MRNDAVGCGVATWSMDEQLTEPIGMSTPVPVRAFLMGGLGALVLVVAVGVAVQSFGSGESGPPEPTAVMIDEMRMVDDYAADGDCRAIAGHLRVALTQLGLPGTEQNLQAATLVRYAEDAQGRIGCEITADLTLERDRRIAGSSRTAAH